MDFAAASRKDQHIEMFMAMEKALIQAKCMVQPVIFVLPEVDKGIVGNVFFFLQLFDTFFFLLSKLFSPHRKAEGNCQETPGPSDGH